MEEPRHCSPAPAPKGWSAHLLLIWEFKLVQVVRGGSKGTTFRFVSALIPAYGKFKSAPGSVGTRRGRQVLESQLWLK